MRILGMMLVGWILFITPVLQAQGFGDTSWVTRDIVPHVNWSCGGVLLDSVEIVTARHCTRGEDVIYVRMSDSHRRAARLICRSVPEVDMAVGRMVERAPLVPAIEVRYPSNPIGESVVVAGYPNGNFVVMAAQVLYALEDIHVQSPDVVIPLVYVISNPSGKGPGGFSGGPVFDTYHRLIGIICCGSPSLGTVAMIPLERQIAECPLSR